MRVVVLTVVFDGFIVGLAVVADFRVEDILVVVLLVVVSFILFFKFRVVVVATVVAVLEIFLCDDFCKSELV